MSSYEVKVEEIARSLYDDDPCLTMDEGERAPWESVGDARQDLYRRMARRALACVIRPTSSAIRCDRLGFFVMWTGWEEIPGCISSGMGWTSGNSRDSELPLSTWWLDLPDMPEPGCAAGRTLNDDV